MSSSSSSRLLKEHCPSNITIVLSAAPLMPAESWRPVVMTIDSPIPFRVILWRGAGARSLRPGNAWAALKLKKNPSASRYMFNDSESTVVQRWVSPHQESTALIIPKFLCDHLFIDQGSLPMPDFNSSCVIRYGWIANRILCL